MERDPAPRISMRDTYMLEYGVVQPLGGPDGGVGQVGDCQSGSSRGGEITVRDSVEVL
jgi:hypothetical protein